MRNQDIPNIKKNQFKVILPTKNLIFAHKRLQYCIFQLINQSHQVIPCVKNMTIVKDLQEIQNDPIPLCGVSARPLETNILVWHVNLRGPKKTRYQGGIYHFQIKFPQSYPTHPPTIRALTAIAHPNVFNGYVCLDFLNLSKDKLSYSSYEWNPIYSVQSILYQLQGFLKNQNLMHEEIANPTVVGYANAFRCNQCKHKGTGQPWPPLQQNDNKGALYRLVDDPQKIEIAQIKCYYTKLHFTENQLGLGLNISKIPKTGMIKEAIIFEDYLSIKALLKQSINRTVNKQLITHWFPLYFGKVDNQQRFFFFLKRSFSMIMTNSTKYFKPEFILEIIPKIFINLVFQIMDRNKYLSINLIRLFSYIHSTFLYCIRAYPELEEKVKQYLAGFISDENYRTKDHTPNLGCLLAYLLVTDSFQFSDIIQAYFAQQLDRHVFWIMKAVPELISSQLSQNADSVRNQLAFNCQKTSFHIICFYHLFLSHCQKRKTKKQMLGQYEQNICRLKMDEENQLQNQIFNIFKSVKTFKDYFQYIGLAQKSQEQVNSMLKQAIKNSERKKYHNSQDILEWEQNMNLKKMGKNQRQNQAQIIKKANISKQISRYYQNNSSYQKYIHVEFPQKMDENHLQDVKYSQSENKQQDWKELCLERWLWIKQCLINDHTLTAEEISQQAFQCFKKGVTSSGQRLYKLHDRYHKAHQNFVQPEVKLPKMTWKTLFLRLDLEDFLKYFDINADFPKFYQRLYVCWKNNVNTLMVPLIQINNIKSGFFYITALLTRLTTLKFLQFACLPNCQMKLHEKLAKAINKGLHNFYEKNGRLQILSFYNILTEKDLSEHLFKKGYFCQSITSFRINSSNLFSFKSALKYFTSLIYPQLEQIQISGCQMTVQTCGILADFLIKLKKLKIFRLKNEHNLKGGISLILSNLAFNSSLRLLDIGQITITNEVHEHANEAIRDVTEKLGKLIKINSNIEFLILNDILNLNKMFGLQFWKNLGQSISLKLLDLSNRIPNNSLSTKMFCLGRAVGFNAKKKGLLSYVNVSGSVSGANSIQNLYEGMKISQYDEEQWYGSITKLAQMIPENYEKIFYNNLQILNFDYCPNLDLPFSLHQHQQLINAQESPVVKLIADSPKLSTLTMVKTGLTKNFAEILYLALDQSRQGLKTQIKVLNLSQNQIGSDGMITLATIIKGNNNIEALDLSKTNMGVSGIHQISLALKQKMALKYLNVFNNNIGFDGAKYIAQNIIAHPSNLQFLEVGHNRIRGKGLILIIDAILSNPESKLMILGLRFNFLSNIAIIKSIKRITQGKSAIKELFLRNNLIDDFGISELKQIISEANLKITVDILDRFDYLMKQKADKTVWIHPIGKLTLPQFKDFFEVKHQCGIIINIRIRTGKKYPSKKGSNKFCFIQFADEESVKLALTLAANKQASIDGVKFRIFKSGTGTFVYHKKSAKLVKRDEAQKLLPQLNLPIPNTTKKNVTAVKIKNKPAINSIVQPQLQKCEERYLDQIKPRSLWKRKAIYAFFITSFLGLAYVFLRENHQIISQN